MNGRAGRVDLNVLTKTQNQIGDVLEKGSLSNATVVHRIDDCGAKSVFGQYKMEICGSAYTTSSGV